MEIFTLAISLFALAVSATALYAANFWKGKVICSKPTQFFFGYATEDKTAANIHLQCFIHSSGTVGQVIDHMFLELKQGEIKQRFTQWSAGTAANNRMKLAGFKVPRDGHSIDFMFFTPSNAKGFRFSKEPIKLSLHSRLSGSKKHLILFEEDFTITPELFSAIEDLNIAAFELNSTGETYYGYASQYTYPLTTPKDPKLIDGNITSHKNEETKK